MGEGSSVMWSKRFEREGGGGRGRERERGGGSFDLERKTERTEFLEF